MINGKITTRATASPAPAMASIVKNNDTTLSHTPRFSSSSYMMLRASKIRLYAGFGAPQRDSKPQKEAEDELASLFAAMREISSPIRSSVPAGTCRRQSTAVCLWWRHCTPAANRGKQSNQ
jgi:hypothetical protein